MDAGREKEGKKSQGKVADKTNSRKHEKGTISYLKKWTQLVEQVSRVREEKSIRRN